MDSFDTLFAEADASPKPIGVVAAGAADPSVLQAFAEATRRGWIDPLLAGPATAIRQCADELQIDVAGWRILDAADDAAVVAAAVAAIRAGDAKLMMKGQIATPTLLKAVLDRQAGLRTGRVIGQIVLVEWAAGSRRMLLTDTGIAIKPTRDQRLDLARSAVEFAHALGTATPGVALMAASEKVNEAMPETVDAAALAQAITTAVAAGDFPACTTQGPLSFDLAVDRDAVRTKKLAGPVAGQAEILLFPDLNSANLTVKAIMYTAACRFGGILGGATCPIAFMSRADTPATRLHSLAAALRVSRR